MPAKIITLSQKDQDLLRVTFDRVLKDYALARDLHILTPEEHQQFTKRYPMIDPRQGI